MKITPLLLGCICCFLSTSSLAAEADSTSYSYGDWRVDCAEHKDNGTICLMNQQGMDGKSGKVVYRLGMRILDETTRFEILTPLGVLLPKGVTIKVGDDSVAELRYHTCLSQGCIAQTQLDAKLETAFRKGMGATLQISDGSGKAVDLPFSLKGFSSALDKLKASSRK